MAAQNISERTRKARSMVSEALTTVYSVGAPTIYTPAICAILPTMFEGGEDVSEVAAQLGVTTVTFYNWTKNHPDFARAYARGKDLSKAWWMKAGRALVTGEYSKGSAAAYCFTMKNKFAWRDQVEITNGDARKKIEAMIDPNLTPKEAELAYFEIIKDI